LRSIGDLPDDFDYNANIAVGCVMIGLGLYGYAKVFAPQVFPSAFKKNIKINRFQLEMNSFKLP
jgi:hypothetical protein